MNHDKILDAMLNDPAVDAKWKRREMIKASYDNLLARIDYVNLGFMKDGNFISLTLGLDFGGTHHIFGGLVLDDYDETKKRRVGTAAGLDFIMQVMSLFRVNNVSDLKDKIVWVLYEKGKQLGHGSEVVKGIRTPEFDSNEIFLVDDWKREWGFK